VQVPLPTLKSVESVEVTGVAPRVSGPPVAVTVSEPVQGFVVPAPVLGQVTVLLIVGVPSVPVPDSENVVEPPALGLTVTVAECVPALAGLNVRVPLIQVWPTVSVTFAHDPANTEKSVESLFERGLAPRVTGPPFAISVTVPQLLEAPTLVDGHVRDAGLAERLPWIPVPFTVVEGLPLFVLTVMLVVSEPIDCGLNVMVPSAQLWPDVRLRFAVHVPLPTLKSVESVEVTGVAPRVNGPPVAVRETAPVHGAVVPAPVFGQLTVLLSVGVPSTPVPDNEKVVGLPPVGLTVTVAECAPELAGLKVMVPLVQV